MSTFALTLLVLTGVTAVESPSVAAASPATTTGSYLLVPVGNPLVDAAVRAGAAAAVAVVDDTATRALLDDAKAAGMMCAVADGACWLRLAELGGYRGVVFVVGDVVTVAAAEGSRAATAMGRGAPSWSAATQRAFGVAGELRVTVTPKTATVIVDDIAVAVDEGVAVVSVPAGPHTVVVTDDGFDAAERQTVVAPGAVVGVPVILWRSETSTSLVPWGSVLRFTGGGLLIAAALGTGALVVVGQVPYLACYDDQPPSGCREEGAIRTTADSTAVAALAVAGAGIVTGVGALVAGIVVE